MGQNTGLGITPPSSEGVGMFKNQPLRINGGRQLLAYQFSRHLQPATGSEALYTSHIKVPSDTDTDSWAPWGHSGWFWGMGRALPMSTAGVEEVCDCSDVTPLWKKGHICMLCRLLIDLKAHFLVFYILKCPETNPEVELCVLSFSLLLSPSSVTNESVSI